MKSSFIKLLPITLLAFSAQADDKLTTSGYIDLSYSNVSTDDSEDISNLSLDSFHLNLDYTLSDDLKISAHVAGNSDEEFNLEQAHLIYSINESWELLAGKFLSIQGFEAFHAPDLYQYSYSATLVYPAMMNAVATKYKGDGFFVYGSIMASAWNSQETDVENSAYETAFRLTSIENFTFHLGYVSENIADGYSQTLTNLWVSYAIDKLVLAAEYNNVTNWFSENDDGSGWLVMANYSFNEKMALTLRTSGLEIKDGSNSVTDNTKWTISPSYKISDELSILAELNVVDDQILNQETTTLAVEVTATF